MFSKFIRTSLLAAVLSSISASVAGSLNVKVVGPSGVNDVKDLKLTTTITNNGHDVLTLLNDPSGALSDGYLTEKYDTVHTSGIAPVFKGVRVKFSPKAAADHNDVTTLAPGQFITVDHDLSTTYDFTTPGEGSYSFKPKDVFYTVNPSTKEINVIRADTVQTTFIHISGKLVAGSDVPRHEKREQDIGYRNCTSDRQSQIAAAAQYSIRYITESRSYLGQIGGGTPRYTTWFGPYTVSRKDLVKSHYDKIGNSPLSVTYDCSCTNATVFAYVYPNDPSTIYLCGAFWSAPLNGTDSKAGTIVHESSHFTIYGGTQDYAYGQSACKQLAINQPDKAVLNADSHEYFAENNPYLP